MSETKAWWTPGPWVADASSGGWRVEWDGAYRNDGWIIAAELQGPDSEMNARLCASAPDLYEALQRLVIADGDYNDALDEGKSVASYVDKDNERNHAMRAALKVLAKARGEQ